MSANWRVLSRTIVYIKRIDSLLSPKKDGDLTKLILTVLLLCHIFVDLVKISTFLKGDAQYDAT